MKLTAKNVESVILDCLPKDGAFTEEQRRTMEQARTAPEGYIMSHGIMHTMVFDLAKLEQHRTDVCEMLLELPDEFDSRKGGGWSFLNACMTRGGEQWAEHPTIEELIILGQALGLAKFLLPREMWSAFPGGMPYFCTFPNEPKTVEAI